MHYNFGKTTANGIGKSKFLLKCWLHLSTHKALQITFYLTKTEWTNCFGTVARSMCNFAKASEFVPILSQQYPQLTINDVAS